MNAQGEGTGESFRDFLVNYIDSCAYVACQPGALTSWLFCHAFHFPHLVSVLAVMRPFITSRRCLAVSAVFTFRTREQEPEPF
jgi:hypothetical protein